MLSICRYSFNRPYNLNRKIVLLSIWGLTPLMLYFDPTLLGAFTAHSNHQEYLQNLSVLWILLGLAAIVFRSIQLFFQASPVTGLAWAIKILSDPFHDVKLYHMAPIHVLRGELYDPVVEHS